MIRDPVAFSRIPAEHSALPEVELKRRQCD